MYSNYFNWNCVEIISAYKRLFLSGAFLGIFVFTTVSLHYTNDYIHLYGIICSAWFLVAKISTCCFSYQFRSDW